MPRLQYKRPEFLVDPITIPPFMVQYLARSGYLTFKHKHLFGSKLNLIFSAPKSGNGLILGFNKKYFKVLNKIVGKGGIRGEDLRLAKEKGLFNPETIRKSTLGQNVVGAAKVSLEGRARVNPAYLCCTFIGLMEDGEITHACISSPLFADSSALCCLKKDSGTSFRCWIFRRNLGPYSINSKKERKYNKAYYVLENFKTLRKTSKGKCLMHGRSLTFDNIGRIVVENYVNGLKSGFQVSYQQGCKTGVEKVVSLSNKAVYRTTSSNVMRSVNKVNFLTNSTSISNKSKRKKRILDRRIGATIDPVEQMDICSAGLAEAMRHEELRLYAG